MARFAEWFYLDSKLDFLRELMILIFNKILEKPKRRKRRIKKSCGFWGTISIELTNLFRLSFSHKKLNFILLSYDVSVLRNVVLVYESSSSWKLNWKINKNGEINHENYVSKYT